LFYSVIKFLANIIFRVLYRVKTYGLENVPKDGKFILCSNHANNLDPVFVSMIMPRKISWMAKKELFKYKTTSYFGYKLGAFPVDRSQSDISAIKNALRVLKDDKVLGIFPEGTRVKRMDLESAKPGVALLSIKSGANILPVHIESNYKLFSKINIYIGKTMDISNKDGSKPSTEDYIEKSKLVLKTIYGLQNN
jgi:1-acyl-sn-glycerol-3-phosphate acyltransferase